MVHQLKLQDFLDKATAASARRALVKVRTTSKLTDKKSLIGLFKSTWEEILLRLKNDTKEALIKTAAEFGITLRTSETKAQMVDRVLKTFEDLWASLLKEQYVDVKIPPSARKTSFLSSPSKTTLPSSPLKAEPSSSPSNSTPPNPLRETDTLLPRGEEERPTGPSDQQTGGGEEVRTITKLVEERREPLEQVGTQSRHETEEPVHEEDWKGKYRNYAKANVRPRGHGNPLAMF